MHRANSGSKASQLCYPSLGLDARHWLQRVIIPLNIQLTLALTATISFRTVLCFACSAGHTDRSLLPTTSHLRTAKTPEHPYYSVSTVYFSHRVLLWSGSIIGLFGIFSRYLLLLVA